MTVLLDANVLIALLDDQHVHHQWVRHWVVTSKPAVASCPITQGAVVRHLLRTGRSIADALAVLGDLPAAPRHQFWPDDLPYRAVDMAGVIGHRQVTDAYLAALARARNGRLATLDRGLAVLHPDVAELIEST